MGSDVLDLRNIHLKRISIHAPAWGATVFSFAFHNLKGISIHAPAWGATSVCRRRFRRARYFNPRSRMGSDKSYGSPSSSHPVFQSTLPHGERRCPWGVGRESRHISIHAPAWGATGRPRPSRTPPTYFNPRSRMGSDVNAIMHGELSSENFNPRSRMGSDRSRRAPRVDRRGFQSTLPHGERHRGGAGRFSRF